MGGVRCQQTPGIDDDGGTGDGCFMKLCPLEELLCICLLVENANNTKTGVLLVP
jgi:hypothetical protein